MTSFSERLIGAAKLDVHIYEEVEADTGATAQAMTVVILSSVAQGIGALKLGGSAGLLAGAIGALIGWFVWAFLVYLIGTKLLPEPNTRSDVGELLRTTGFSASPGVLGVLGLLPLLGGLIMFAANIWMLIAMVVAVRQALDYQSTGRAIGVCVIGWLARVVIMVVLMLVFGVRST
ncbi:YIP1 family protein [Acidobacteria bacterium AH-259-A15]|nr:YIP1 family protein [Acidobacteria bacterium AH-259-A15]